MKKNLLFIGKNKDNFDIICLFCFNKSCIWEFICNLYLVINNKKRKRKSERKLFNDRHILFLFCSPFCLYSLFFMEKSFSWASMCPITCHQRPGLQILGFIWCLCAQSKKTSTAAETLLHYWNELRCTAAMIYHTSLSICFTIKSNTPNPHISRDRQSFPFSTVHQIRFLLGHRDSYYLRALLLTGKSHWIWC